MEAGLVLSIGSIGLNIILGLVAFAWRESMGEVKRRLTETEAKVSKHSDSIVALDERSKGVATMLERIEHAMVPRNEWEARHKATDAMLARILERLDSR
jgi:hypothetical protein